MKRETISRMLDHLDDKWIREAEDFRPGAIQDAPERSHSMNMKKRLVSIALAAALILALGVTAFAVWSIHSARQQEIRSDLRIDENKVGSYVEYETPDGGNGLTLLSSVNDGEAQRVYVNVSPVSVEEAAAFPNSYFVWCIEGSGLQGFAAPALPVELSLQGDEEIRNAVLQYAYDEQTQTLTVECYISQIFIEKAQDELGTDSLPLTLGMAAAEGEEPRVFGPVNFTPTEEQRRVFDFGPAVYHDEELGLDIEIVSLELTPFSAVWSVRYDAASSFHTPEADWYAYQPWSELEDRVCIESLLYFSDGSSFSTGGALATPFEDGVVKLICGWGGAIDIDDVQEIDLGELVLWENG